MRFSLFVIVLTLASVSLRTGTAQGSQTPRIQDRWVGIQAAHQGRPWLNLDDGRGLEVRFNTDSGPAVRFSEQQAEGSVTPLSLVSLDFDEDGISDIVYGYAASEGGFLILQRGDPDWKGRTILATGSVETLSNDPFLPEASVIEVNRIPRFVEAGDFNADGHLDLVVADLNAGSLTQLLGDGDGHFIAGRDVHLPGRLTTLAAGDVNRSDGLIDILVGIERTTGPALLVFEGPDGALSHPPEVIELPSPAVDLEISQFDSHYPFDIVVAVETEILIVHGRDRKLNQPQSRRLAVPAPEVSRYSFASRILSIAAGDFVADHEDELALWFEDGRLRLLERTGDGLQLKSDWMPGLGVPSQNIRPGTGTPSHRLVRARVSGFAKDELLAVDALAQKIHVLVTAKASGGDSSGTHLANSGSAALAVAGTPVAVLPMRLNRDALSDLVVLSDGYPSLSTIVTQSSTTFTVNRSEDNFTCLQPEDPGGECTLRGAIHKANQFASGPGPFTIQFSVDEVTLTRTFGDGGADLEIFKPMSIQGGGNVLVTASDRAFFNQAVFHIFSAGANSSINGLRIAASANAIMVEGTTMIEGNVIGSRDKNADGQTFSVSTGITLINTSNSTIKENQFPNVSNSAIRIQGESHNNTIEDNLIGLDSQGKLSDGTSFGIDIVTPASGTIIKDNTIAGTGRGIRIQAAGLSANAFPGGHMIQGNKIGVNSAGTTKLARGSGISIANSTNSTIGGTSSALANVIGGDPDNARNGFGIRLSISSDGTKVMGNLIGTNASGAKLGHARNGIDISADNIELGGGASAGNVIAFNGRDGVNVSSTGLRNAILGNSIHSNGDPNRDPNGFLGIDLGPSRVTLNDAGDSDEGANNLQNFPVLTKVSNTSNIEGTLDSTPGTTFTIQLFANDECDPSGHGEGQTLLDSFPATTDGNGNVTFVIGNVPDAFITATATGPNGTSEFSACAGEAREALVVNSTFDFDVIAGVAVLIEDDNPGDGVCSTGKKISDVFEPCDRDINGDCECTLRAAIQEANAREGKDTINFDSEVKLIVLRQSLPDISESVLIEGDVLAKVKIDGSFASTGLRLEGIRSTIRGLEITGFSCGEIFVTRGCSGIELAGSGEHQIQGCTFRENSRGIDVLSDGNVIGGRNTAPIFTGDLTLGFCSGACECVDPCNFFVDNEDPEEDDPFPPATFQAILIGGMSRGNLVQGNLVRGNDVGLNVAGSMNTIGGTVAGVGNIFFDNQPGVLITGMGNDVQGNTFDLNLAALDIKGGALQNTIGGLTPGAGNVFEHNGSVLSIEDASRRNRILSNIFVNNRLLAIDLASEGNFHVDENDRNDEDSGPNDLQNYPVLQSATDDGETVLIRGRLDSGSNSDFLIQLFSNAVCDADQSGAPQLFSKVGEGETLLVSKEVTSNDVGNGFIVVRVPTSQLSGPWITATATDSEGNTSEFSKCLELKVDSDGDLISDEDENRASGSGDGNGDGTPDRDQGNVVTLDLTKLVGKTGSGGTVTLETTGANLFISDLFEPFEVDVFGEIIADGNVGLGSIGFKLTKSVEVLALGAGEPESFTVTLFFPSGFLAKTYYNFGPTPDNPDDHLYEFLFDGTTGAEISEDQIVLYFVDGLRGDHDLAVNGEILTLGGPATRATTFYFPQIGDGAAGNIQFQSSLVFNNTAGITPVQVELFNPEGGFLDLEFSDLAKTSLFEFGLNPGESFSTQTPGTDPIQVGYARVIAAQGLGGTAVFSQTDSSTGTLLFEAGVPASESFTDFSLYVDTLGNRNTGLAIAYPVPRGGSGDEVPSANLMLRLYDKSFDLIATAPLQLAPGEHRARFIAELFEQQAALLADFEGSLTVESDQPIVGVTLRQNDDPTRSFPEDVPALTTFPVIPGRADSDLLSTQGASQAEFFFPQVGDGTAGTIQFQTAMIFVNTGLDSNVQADFFDSFGAPLSLDFGTGGSGSSLSFSMKSGEALAIQTPGTGGLQVGYARITAGSGVRGTVFSVAPTSRQERSCTRRAYRLPLR